MERSEHLKIRKKTFTRWCNEHLKHRLLKIDDLRTDLGDGVKLIELMEHLTRKKLGPYTEEPRERHEMIRNINKAVSFIVTEECIKVNFVSGTSDIVDGNLKSILGLIWSLILHYQIAIGFGLKNQPQKALIRALLDYINGKLTDKKVENFTSDWNDGTTIAALVDSMAPGLCPVYVVMKPETALKNATHAMQLAEDWLGIIQFLDPEDMVNPHSDKFSMVTYLSQFLDCKLRPGAPIIRRHSEACVSNPGTSKMFWSSPSQELLPKVKKFNSFDIPMTGKMMSPKNVRITLHVQSEVEIKSILKKADLCEIVRKKLCFKEEDITLEQRDNKSKKWEELPSKGANRNLMLEDGMELKLKKQIQDYVDFDTEDDETEICLVAKKSSLQVDIRDDLEWDNVGTWLPDNRLWKGEGELVEYLRIYFFEDTENVLDRFYYRFRPLTPGVIMEIINEVWNMDGVENGQCVPKFKCVDNNKAEVRVQFHSSDGSWSMLGSAAQGGSLNNPTVVLNFNHCMDDFDIKATIAHQFGHVLGLGHMHQEPKYWHVIRRFIDLEKMLNDLNISRKQFCTQWINMEYHDENFVHDEYSVMHYQTKLSWLKNQECRGKADLRDLTERKEITMEEYIELRRFHKHTKLFCCEPSYFDKLKLAEAYYNVSKKIPTRYLY